MARKPAVAIVGPGRWGAALARQMARAGYRIDEIVSRDNPASRQKAAAVARDVDSRAVTLELSRLEADLIWLCVPDREIARVARQLARRAFLSLPSPASRHRYRRPGDPKPGNPKPWKNKVVFHSSGALGSGELGPLQGAIAGKASVHPMMSYLTGGAASWRGVFFGVEGDAAARRLAQTVVRDLGGKTFVVRPGDKEIYHAWCTFLSPLLIGLLATSERVAQKAGIDARLARQRGMPLIAETLANYSARGAAGALSGPTTRGDADVIRRHLKSLRGLAPASEVYLAIERATLAYLPGRNKAAIKQALAGGARSPRATPRKRRRRRRDDARKAPAR
jgi:predicted short-subunit dehydrogenase-like oxidoreductase (DUF2520 family)